jgi:flagella basal body P-ring formation protein FlgA
MSTNLKPNNVLTHACRVLFGITLLGRAFACQVVAEDRITGKDLFAAVPAFAALDPNLVIGATPMAGVPRIIRIEELVKIANQNHIDAAPELLQQVCFERATELLTAEKLVPVLQAAVAIEGAQIEIVDFSHFAIPLGTLEFKRASLTAAGMWRGRVIYGEGKSVPIWAKVHVTIESTWIEPTKMLLAGKVVEASQLVVRTGPRFPFGPVPLDSLDLAAGREAIRTIQPGVPIFAALLQTAHEIERGDRVAVEVWSGGALLEFEGTAEASGRLGDSIAIRNPENGKSFQARVDGKGKVSVKK